MEIARRDVEHFKVAISKSSGLRQYQDYVDQLGVHPRNHKPFVVVLTGHTGAGKTYLATSFSEAVQGRHYFLNPVAGNRGEPWMDGYSGVEPIVIDEFAGEIKLTWLNRLLDKYQFQGQTKGGSVEVRASLICITSNIPMSEWYPNDISTLQRRVNVVLEFSGRPRPEDFDRVHDNLQDLLCAVYDEPQNVNRQIVADRSDNCMQHTEYVSMYIYQDGSLARRVEPVRTRIDVGNRSGFNEVPIRQVEPSNDRRVRQRRN